MIEKIYQSIYAKPLAVLLAVSILCMSFKAGGSDEAVLNAGTNIPLETTMRISSELIFPGQMIDFRVISDVKVGDKTVIAAGSIAKGQVIRAEKAKGLGKEGFLFIQLKSVKAVDGQEIFLNGGNVQQEGEDRVALAVVLGVVVCILFLLIKGKNAMIPSGYQVNASVASTTTIKI